MALVGAVVTFLVPRKHNTYLIERRLLIDGDAKPEEVQAAERIVLPGQGAMPDCMRELRESGLLDAVLDAATIGPRLATRG